MDTSSSIIDFKLHNKQLPASNDALPENDRICYTISPDARKEILKRLLKLNHEIHEQEMKESKPLKTKKKETKKSHKPGAVKQLNMF